MSNVLVINFFFFFVLLEKEDLTCISDIDTFRKVDRF